MSRFVINNFKELPFTFNSGVSDLMYKVSLKNGFNLVICGAIRTGFDYQSPYNKLAWRVHTYQSWLTALLWQVRVPV